MKTRSDPEPCDAQWGVDGAPDAVTAAPRGVSGWTPGPPLMVEAPGPRREAGAVGCLPSMGRMSRDAQRYTARPRHHPLQALQDRLSPRVPSCWRPSPQREPWGLREHHSPAEPSCTLTSSPEPHSLGRPGGVGVCLILGLLPEDLRGRPGSSWSQPPGPPLPTGLLACPPACRLRSC